MGELKWVALEVALVILAIFINWIIRASRGGDIMTTFFSIPQLSLKKTLDIWDKIVGTRSSAQEVAHPAERPVATSQEVARPAEPPAQVAPMAAAPIQEVESPIEPTPAQAALVVPQPALAAVRPPAVGGDLSWLTQKPRVAPRLTLSEVAQSDNIAVIGPKGAGKTTLLLTIMANRPSQYVALDPHNSPGKWPCQVAGAGRKYAEIDAALRGLDAAMSKRFEQLALGEVAEGQFERRTVVADEFRSIAQQLANTKDRKGAGKYILDRISEGRKVGECVLLAGHNDTVGDLGIEGSSAMKTCFDYIIYVGGMAFQRFADKDKGAATSEMLAELQAEERQIVAWETATGRWFIVDFDLEPQMSSVSAASDLTSGKHFPQEGGSEALPELGKCSEVGMEVLPEGSGIDDEVIKALHVAGWSKTKISGKLTGRTETRFARIRQVLGE
jgi:hypothetical protein